jgi:hypothetical protein
MTPTFPLFPSRTCGDCTYCCKIMGIKEIDKVPGKWCPHCNPRKGCTIYGSHPTECREFACMWLADGKREVLKDSERPDKIKALMWMDEVTPAIEMILQGDKLNGVVHVTLDVGGNHHHRPLKDIIDRFLGKRFGVIIAQGDYRKMLLPDPAEHAVSLPGY